MSASSLRASASRRADALFGLAGTSSADSRRPAGPDPHPGSRPFEAFLGGCCSDSVALTTRFTASRHDRGLLHGVAGAAVVVSRAAEVVLPADLVADRFGLQTPAQAPTVPADVVRPVGTGRVCPLFRPLLAAAARGGDDDARRRRSREARDPSPSSAITVRLRELVRQCRRAASRSTQQMGMLTPLVGRMGELDLRPEGGHVQNLRDIGADHCCLEPGIHRRRSSIDDSPKRRS